MQDCRSQVRAFKVIPGITWGSQAQGPQRRGRGGRRQRGARGGHRRLSGHLELVILHLLWPASVMLWFTNILNYKNNDIIHMDMIQNDLQCLETKFSGLVNWLCGLEVLCTSIVSRWAGFQEHFQCTLVHCIFYISPCVHIKSIASSPSSLCHSN